MITAAFPCQSQQCTLFCRVGSVISELSSGKIQNCLFQENPKKMIYSGGHVLSACNLAIFKTIICGVKG